MAGSDARERLTDIASRLGEMGTQLEALRGEVDQMLSVVESAPASTPSGIDETAPGQLELEYVNEALRKLVYGTTQEEILESYLEEAQTFVQRAILFLHRDGRYVTWKGFGFVAENIKAETNISTFPAAAALYLLGKHQKAFGVMDEYARWLEVNGMSPEKKNFRRFARALMKKMQAGGWTRTAKADALLDRL